MDGDITSNYLIRIGINARHKCTNTSMLSFKDHRLIKLNSLIYVFWLRYGSIYYTKKKKSFIEASSPLMHYLTVSSENMSIKCCIFSVEKLKDTHISTLQFIFSYKPGPTSREIA